MGHPPDKPLLPREPVGTDTAQFVPPVVARGDPETAARVKTPDHHTDDVLVSKDDFAVDSQSEEQMLQKVKDGTIKIFVDILTPFVHVQWSLQFKTPAVNKSLLLRPPTSDPTLVLSI